MCGTAGYHTASVTGRETGPVGATNVRLESGMAIVAYPTAFPVTGSSLRGPQATWNKAAVRIGTDHASRRRAFRSIVGLPSDHWCVRKVARVTRDAKHRWAGGRWSWRSRGSRRLTLVVDLYNVLNLINSGWGAERVFPVGISSQNPVVNRLPLLRIVGFDPATQRFRYTVNEQVGVLPKVAIRTRSSSDCESSPKGAVSSRHCSPVRALPPGAGRRSRRPF